MTSVPTEIVKQAQGYLIDVSLFRSALTEQKPRGSGWRGQSISFVPLMEVYVRLSRPFEIHLNTINIIVDFKIFRL